MNQATNTAVVTLDDLLTDKAKVAALVSTMGAALQLVVIKPATQALATTGLQAQAYIDLVAADIEVSRTLEIDSDDMLKETQEINGRLAAVFAEGTGKLDTERYALVTPLNDLVNKINAGYKVPRLFGLEVLDGNNRKVLAYNRKKQEEEDKRLREEQAERDRVKREADEKAAAAARDAEAMLAKAKAEADSGNHEQAQAIIEQAAAAMDTARVEQQQAIVMSTTRTSFGGGGGFASGVRKKWKCKRLDDKKALLHIATLIVADDYSLAHLIPFDDAALNKQADLQKRAFDIPGLHAYEEESISNRKAKL